MPSTYALDASQKQLRHASAHSDVSLTYLTARWPSESVPPSGSGTAMRHVCSSHVEMLRERRERKEKDERVKQLVMGKMAARLRMGTTLWAEFQLALCIHRSAR